MESRWTPGGLHQDVWLNVKCSPFLSTNMLIFKTWLTNSDLPMQSSCDANGKWHTIFEGSRPFDIVTDCENAWCTLCRGNWKCIMARGNITAGCSFCYRNSLAVHSEPRTSPLGGTKAGYSVSRVH